MTNILFEYLYRDTANYKNHVEAMFTNLEGLPLADIEARVCSIMKALAKSFHDEFNAEMVQNEMVQNRMFPISSSVAEILSIEKVANKAENKDIFYKTISG